MKSLMVNIYRISVLVVTAILGLTLIFGAPVFAFDKYDLSDPDDLNPNKITASDIIRSYAGECDEVEVDFLDKNDDFVIKYSDNIPITAITSTFQTQNNEDGFLTVKADPFTYVSASGNPVTWLPHEVWLNDRAMTLDGENWTAEVSGADGDKITAQYVTDITVQADDLNGILSKAYYAGKSASEKLETERQRYEAEYARYVELKAEYDNYMQSLELYNASLKLYNAYLTELSNWNKANERYNKYLGELASYDEAEREYQDFFDKVRPQYYASLARYRQYLEDYKQYEEALERYKAQTNSPDAQKAVFHYEIMAYFTQSMTDLKRSLSAAIQGDAVTKVLNERELLKQVEVKTQDIERANKATIALRELLANYDQCTTNEQRYDFYVTCYEELRDNFCELLRVLDYMYHGFGMIRNGIDQMERTRQFQILLAQLYYVCNALTDGEVQNYRLKYWDEKKPEENLKKIGEYNFDASYKIGPDHDKRSPAEILGEEGLLEDKNLAAPLENGFLELPDKPLPPVRVENPGDPPMEPSRPIRPTEVPSPGEPPAEVQMPEPLIEVLPPTLPAEYTPSEDERKLAEAYGAGRLENRSEVKDPYVMKVTCLVTRFFRNAKYTDVMFFAKEYDPDLEQEATLIVEGVEAGASVSYEGKLPEKHGEGYTYTFDHWVDENGTKIDLSHIETDRPVLKLYPYFSAKAQLFTVVWTVDGREITDSCPYDRIPEYDEDKNGALIKQDTGLRQYRFIGWQSGDKFYGLGEPLEVMTTQTARYNAVFESSYLIKFVVDGVPTSISVWEGDLPVFADPVKEADRIYVYNFTGWDKPIEPATRDISYEAKFDREPIMKYSGGNGTVSLEHGVYVVNSPSANGELNISNLMKLCKQKGRGTEIVFALGVLKMDEEAVKAAIDKDVHTVTVENSSNAYEYNFTLFFKGGVGNNIIADDIEVYFEAECSLKKDNTYLTSVDREGNSHDVRFDNVASGVGFFLRPDCRYTLRELYRVETVPSDFVSIETSKKYFAPGEKVTLSISEPAPGMYIGSIYVLASDGGALSAVNGSFKMPRSSVVVGVVCGYYEYTVKFKSDGKTLRVRQLRYGDIINPPTDPQKPFDGENRYVFKGWVDEQGNIVTEFGTVVGDAVYEASYDATPFVLDPPPDTKLNKIIRVARIVIPIIICLAVGLTVLLVVRHIRRKKAKKS